MKEVNNIEELNQNLITDLITHKGEPGQCLWEGLVLFEVTLPLIVKKEGLVEIKTVSFFNCQFRFPVDLENTLENIYFENCIFHSEVKAWNAHLKGKTRFRNCEFKGNANFTNTKFEELADFWNCTFHNPITFFKTDFNGTAVFSSVTFKENVLFTYTLFGGKTIFGRTNFSAGVDFSQSIISGELKLFDLKFDFKNYVAEYVGSDDEKFQNLIHLENKIPLINKVTTFQIFKNQFDKQGNHIDEIEMRKQEKIAFALLNKSRREDIQWTQNTTRNQIILWLNRWSNNYRSDFGNGIICTGLAAFLFLFLTFISTMEFWNRICLNCEMDWSVIGYTIKQYINYLNPVHSMDFIDELRPIFGISYIFDFFGRITVGYGIYQTIQAFRKYK